MKWCDIVMASDQKPRAHLVRKKRSPRRYAPRDDTGIDTFIFVFADEGAEIQ